MKFLPTIRALVWLGCSVVAAPALAQPARPAAAKAFPTPTVIPNPVLPGDYPDPSVVKVGDTYWATATTSNWGPVFPLLKSRNLTDWQLVGHVFPRARPAWADYYFWAPEISQDNGKIYVFYTAHQRGGNLAVGVASADKPEGPYRDHGPLVGQPAGSIDGFPVRDENGKPYLIWKEDGNSIQQPTPIWAQEMNAGRTALIGEKKELLRNDVPWEGNLIEGPSLVRRAGYFYMFYAGNGCCGSGCTYATGVARARNLLGPWEKYAQNPILVKNETWTCPGHGTAVEKDGRWFMLHHAYQTGGSFENVGRQGVLSEFTWTAAGWPEFLNQHSTPAPAVPAARLAALAVRDEFEGQSLPPSWQWPVENQPTFALSGGQLRLQAQPTAGGAALGRSTVAAAYTASTTLLRPAALPAGASAGLAALGDPANTLALTVEGGKIGLVQTKAGKRETLAQMPLTGAGQAVQLRYQVRDGDQYRFAWSADGQAWHPLPADGQAVSGDFLPPWDRGVRAGVMARGPVTATAVFERFAVSNGAK
ncbi:family 43 glycosylhydrolase [uncultured Hymenobacter sp.]|uniref:family 43 glycosylhydrolase n=1 Tax=uncultured Hymenobacter sp. TaxID=170016 RepID=UPI0035CB2C5D